MELTFEQLPTAVTLLTKEVSELKELLLKKSEQPTNQPTNQPSTGRNFKHSAGKRTFEFICTNIVQQSIKK